MLYRGHITVPFEKSKRIDCRVLIKSDLHGCCYCFIEQPCIGDCAILFTQFLLCHTGQLYSKDIVTQQQLGFLFTDSMFIIDVSFLKKLQDTFFENITFQYNITLQLNIRFQALRKNIFIIELLIKIKITLTRLSYNIFQSNRTKITRTSSYISLNRSFFRPKMCR